MTTKTIYGLGEILLRLQNKKTGGENLDNFQLYFGGAEFNVLVGLAGLENKTSMLSIIPNNFLGNQIERIAKGFDIQTNHLLRETGNQGIYFVQQNLGCKPSIVTYNRKNSVFVENINKFNNKNFGKFNDWIHISGITLALSEATFQTSLNLLKKAKKENLKISFDFNFRSKLIDYKTASVRYQKILEISDLIFASKRDFVSIFKWNDKLSEKQIFQKVFENYNVEYIANSTKKTTNNINYYKGNLYSHKESVSSKFLPNILIDRIGGGDAFAAGVLNGIIKNKEMQTIVDKATIQAVLAHSTQGDYAYISNKEIESFQPHEYEGLQR